MNTVWSPPATPLPHSHARWVFAAACLLATGMTPPNLAADKESQTAVAQADAVRSPASVPVELTFTARQEHADPFNAVALDVVFESPDGLHRRVPAFWAGTNRWKARYASEVPGSHPWRSECSVTNDAGLHGITGRVEVTPYTGSNPLFRHGPIRVAADRRHFEHADGTPFLWLGDTWWMGLCHRLHWPDEFRQLTADRREKGFNVIQLVAGLYPDMHPFDPRGANEAGFPWETNYTRIRPEYFDAADLRLRFLIDQGFTPCLVGAWGYFLPWTGPDRMKAHWRYLIARYAAWPMVWCAAGEANLPWYLAKNFPSDDQDQARGWCDVMRFILSTDPWRRPLTVHPTAINAYTARHLADAGWLMDFDFLQTPHAQREAAVPAVRTVLESRRATPTLPVVNGEASYEMLMDQLPTRWSRAMFWLCFTSGSAGHTYGANGIWQLNRRGQPHGPSPTAGSPPSGYGVITWDDAMRLPGSAQIGAAKRWLERLPWWELEPHPEWAAWTDETGPPPALGSWIWLEPDAGKSAPVAPRWFRRKFELPADAKLLRARLRITADDRFTAWLNGIEVASAANWREPTLVDVTVQLRRGANLLAVRAENSAAPVTANPAGLNAVLEIERAEQAPLRIVTDAEWRARATEEPGWREPGYADGEWTAAAVTGPYGAAPWGRLEGTAAVGPCVRGTADGPRLVYRLDPRAVLLRELGAGRRWRATSFDPVTAIVSDLGLLVADGRGEAVLAAPDHDHDEATLLEPAN